MTTLKLFCEWTPPNFHIMLFLKALSTSTGKFYLKALPWQHTHLFWCSFIYPIVRLSSNLNITFFSLLQLIWKRRAVSLTKVTAHYFRTSCKVTAFHVGAQVVGLSIDLHEVPLLFILYGTFFWHFVRIHSENSWIAD